MWCYATMREKMMSTTSTATHNEQSLYYGSGPNIAEWSHQMRHYIFRQMCIEGIALLHSFSPEYVCDDDDEMDVMWCVFVSHCHTDYMDIKWINMKSSKNVTIFMLFCLFRRTSVSATSRLASHRCAHTYGNNKWSMRKKKMLFERCCHF